MDKLVGVIQHSTSESDLKQLKLLLSKEEGIFVKNLGVIDDFLSVLDPAIHSLGYAFALAAKASAPKLEPVKFVLQTQRFLTLAAPLQIRMVPQKVAIICHRFKELSIEANQPLRAIKPLRLAASKLSTGSESLTPVHADVVHVCLLAKNYNAALPLLESEIFDVNPETTACTPKDMLLYYYYGGLIYTGLKEYPKAFNFFKMVITAPAVVLSAIMVEGYKKYILLSLLVFGKVQNLPRYTSSVVQRYHKTSFPQYQEFATAFATHDTDELHKCAEIHAELFRKDKNFGLVKQCIQSLYRKNIQRHTQTYLTYSLQDMATSTKLRSPAEAEKRVLRMIEDGEIFATINQKDGMISFQEDPEQYDTKKMTMNLDQKIQKVIGLAQKVRGIEESIASSATYIQRTSVHERGRWGEFGEETEGIEKAIGGPGKLM